MLVRAIFLLALIALLAETIVHGAAALARLSLAHRELAAIRAAFTAAVAAAQQTAPTDTVPAPFATCYEPISGGCAMTATVTLSTPTPVPFQPGSGCPQTDCTVYLQANTAVGESRMQYHLVATVTASNGDALVTRQGDIAFRTFGAPRYASLVGSLDATLDALENGGVGDDGGNIGAAGTLITVEYVPSGASSSPVPGNVWRATNENSPATTPAWDR